MNSNPHSNLSRFYSFFETYGTERLNGLDESYFFGLSVSEKEEAWNFLKNSRALSTERIKGLYLLDKARAVEMFKQLVAAPLKDFEFSAERQAAENSRLSMLSYIYDVEPGEACVSAMCEFANSEFPRVRAAFAQTLPIDRTTPEAVDALKRMIFTEVERIPLTSAITKLMVIHGLDYSMNDPLYNSIYLSLRSDNPKEKAAAMSRLERIQCPNYF